MSNQKIRNENSPLEEKMQAALEKEGIKYKAQFTLLNSKENRWNYKYILDFLVYGEFCKIAVECDGNTYHSSHNGKERDLKRDLWVKNQGIDDTLRFNTEEIKYNIQGVIKQIKDALKAYDKIRYDKNLKSAFDPGMIALQVSKKNADYVYKDLSKMIKDTCIDIHKKIKVTSIKKTTILNKVRKSIFEKGYAEISSSLANFNVQKLNHYKDESDLFFWSI
ncbi:endonuclease domain-containing protein [Cytobacillus pseudoceanisediminis]|uniref:endonuclease domain-containing protein n=1 Tax=Cytobacillus pseudoceanisediminis TaxID=3051614 RepID=UPI003657E171